MKVLTFTSLYPNNIWPNHGVFIKERMVQFSNLEGCELRVIAPVPYFPPIKINWRWGYSQVARREVRDGVQVYHPRYFITPKFGMALYGWMLYWSVLPTVKQLQREFDFDLIDAHFVYPDGFAAVQLGRVFNKPVVISARGSDVNLYANLPVIRKILGYTLRHAARVISVCSALKEAMHGLGIPNEKITIISNGVDLKKFYPSQMAEARKSLGLPQDKKIILSVGSLIPRKGFDVLIKALKRVKDSSDLRNLFLVIVGEGPSQKDLSKLASFLNVSDDVRLAGSVQHKDLHLWYSAADIFCLASDREGWPNVLLESLACGTPVVAANIWGVPEVIQSDALGLLTERTENAFSDAILHAFKKEWHAETLFEYARNHTWNRTAVAVRALFESVLSGQPGQ